jgi:hypothetical protein
MKNSGYTWAISSWQPWLKDGLMDFILKRGADWRAFADAI